jgi:hypothetical protein
LLTLNLDVILVATGMRAAKCPFLVRIEHNII